MGIPTLSQEDLTTMVEAQFVDPKSPRFTPQDLEATVDNRPSRECTWGLNLMESVAVAINALVLILGACVVGLLGSTLSSYHNSIKHSESQLQLWPEDIKISPTMITVVCDAVSLIFCLASLCATLVWNFNPKVCRLDDFYTLCSN